MTTLATKDDPVLLDTARKKACTLDTLGTPPNPKQQQTATVLTEAKSFLRGGENPKGSQSTPRRKAVQTFCTLMKITNTNRMQKKATTKRGHHVITSPCRRGCSNNNQVCEQQAAPTPASVHTLPESNRVIASAKPRLPLKSETAPPPRPKVTQQAGHPRAHR